MPVPASPSLLGLTGFNEWRPGQCETIERVLSAFSRGVNAVILEAPTGSGKSLIAAAVAKSLGLTTMILTQTKQLSLQYLDSFDFICGVKGRGNFSCVIEDGIKCDEAMCTVDHMVAMERGCKSICPYYMQKREALKSVFVVSNVFYFLYEANYVKKFSGRGLLTIDEGHLLENALMEFVSISFSRQALRRLDVYLPQFRAIRDIIWWAENARPAVAKAVAEAKASKDVKAQLRAMSHLSRLKDVQKKVKEGEWIFEMKPWGVILKPVWVTDFGSKMVFSHSDRVLVMSATIRSPKQFCHCLGLNENEVSYIEVPSLFPARHRPINFWPAAKIGNKSTLSDLNRLVNYVDRILEKHPNEKGVIHTVSFRLADYIVNNSAYSDRFVTHMTKGRENVIAKFVASSSNAVLVSPSVMIGLDLYDDRARFQIIAKLPFMSLGDPQVNIRRRQNPDWYAWNAACALIQASGRSTRSDDDWSTVYLLDGNFRWFYRRHQALFPDWWTRALHNVRQLATATMPRI